MKTIYIKKGNVHGVYQDKPHSTSYASSLLLWQEYTKLENEAYAGLTNDELQYIPESSHKNWKIRLAFNTNFLKKQQEQKGVLSCVYCGKTNLVIDSPNHQELATADHFIAVSKGGKALMRQTLWCHVFIATTRKKIKMV